MPVETRWSALDFVELEAFVSLAQTLHFGRTAAAINISPSALSRMLGRLEAETGTCLLQRDPRQNSLTEAGLVFLEFAHQSLRQRAALECQLAASDARVRGTLRVFASVTACYSILPPLVGLLGQLYPELRLSIETGDPADAHQVLLDSRVDLALAALDPGIFQYHDCFSVKHSPLVFVAGRAGPYGAPLAVGDAVISAEKLAEQALIIPHKGLARERLDRWLRKHHLQAIVAAEVAGNEAILALAYLGLGLGLVPRLVLENSPFAEGLVQYQAGPEFGDYNIGFVMASNLPRAIDAALRNSLTTAYPTGTWVPSAAKQQTSHTDNNHRQRPKNT